MQLTIYSLKSDTLAGLQFYKKNQGTMASIDSSEILIKAKLVQTFSMVVIGLNQLNCQA